MAAPRSRSVSWVNADPARNRRTGHSRFASPPPLTEPVRSFGAEAVTVHDEAEVAEGIVRAFAVKTRPVVIHCLTSAIQMRAWCRYTHSQTLPSGTVTAAGRGYTLRATARRWRRPP